MSGPLRQDPFAGPSREISRAQLKRYRDVISMWLSKFDTAEIATETHLPEWLVARWGANFRDMTVGVAA